MRWGLFARRCISPGLYRYLALPEGYKDRTHEVAAICNSLHISRSTLYRYLALPEG